MLPTWVLDSIPRLGQVTQSLKDPLKSVGACESGASGVGRDAESWGKEQAGVLAGSKPKFEWFGGCPTVLLGISLPVEIHAGFYDGYVSRLEAPFLQRQTSDRFRLATSRSAYVAWPLICWGVRSRRPTCSMWVQQPDRRLLGGLARSSVVWLKFVPFGHFCTVTHLARGERNKLRPRWWSTTWAILVSGLCTTVFEAPMYVSLCVCVCVLIALGLDV